MARGRQSKAPRIRGALGEHIYQVLSEEPLERANGDSKNGDQPKVTSSECKHLESPGKSDSSDKGVFFVGVKSKDDPTRGRGGKDSRDICPPGLFLLRKSLNSILKNRDHASRRNRCLGKKKEK